VCAPFAAPTKDAGSLVGPFTPSPTTRFVATTLPWVYLKDSVCWTAATPLT